MPADKSGDKSGDDILSDLKTPNYSHDNSEDLLPTSPNMEGGRISRKNSTMQGQRMSITKRRASLAVGAHVSQMNSVPSGPTTLSTPSSHNSTNGLARSEASMSSIGRNSFLSTNRHLSSKDFTESALFKIYRMKLVLFALLANVLLLTLCNFMYAGIVVNIDKTLSETFGCIILEMLFIITNYLTHEALDDGASAFFGYRLCSRQGLSIATCGFFQCPAIIKPLYANEISLSSTIKKTLTWASSLWVLVYIFEWVNPLTPITVTVGPLRSDYGSTPCIVYTQHYMPADRLTPTVSIEAGVSEVVYGSALGIMRSEVSGVNITTAVISPQIVGAVNDGDTILGPGFTIDISSSCSCQTVTSANDLHSSLNMTLSDATTLYNQYSTLYHQSGMASFLYSSSSQINVISILSGVHLCGGLNGTLMFVPVCNTTMQNHLFAEVLVTYMTDGTTASIAAKTVQIIKTGDAADIGTWASTAMTNVLGGVASASFLPDLVPAVMNPLLWWTTPNLLSADPTLLSPGIETMFSILFRGSVQRTYSSKGDSCSRNIEIEGLSVLYFTGLGFYIATAGVITQIFVAFLAFLGFIPWLLSNNPILPGVRLLRDKTYCMALLTQSELLNDAEELCNAPAYSFWQLVDVVCRLGECPETCDDPEYGVITLDNPRKVLPFKNGKNYS